MKQTSDPYYDTDLTNKRYVDKVAKQLDDSNTQTRLEIGNKSKNFGVQPEPPYHINDTYMNGKDIYICIKDRELGSFSASDWKLASDYTNNDVANSKNKVFTNQPIPPYNIGDLWTSGPNGELRRCITSRTSGTYQASDWENATAYDNTKTIIENGLITTGTIQVVNGGTVAAGMTGNDSGDSAIRFWAGSTSGNKANAPFRVTQKGKAYTSDIDISGGKIKLHGSVDSALLKIQIDGNDQIYVQGSPNFLSTQRVDNGATYASAMGYLVVPGFSTSYSKGNIAKQTLVTPDEISLLNQNESNQTICTLTPEQLDVSKVVAGNIDCGTCNLNSLNDTVVSFNKVFKNPPIVILTNTSTNIPNNTVFMGAVVKTTNTDFTAYVQTTQNPSSTNRPFNWIAIGV